jgi:hypothetical protein
VIDFIFIFQMLLGIVFLEKLLLNLLQVEFAKIGILNKAFYVFLQIPNFFSRLTIWKILHKCGYVVEFYLFCNSLGQIF